MKKTIAATLAAAFLMSGCQQTIPKEALQLSHESLQQRQMQTRRFDTSEEAKLLQASAAVIQDLGFTIDESTVPAGLIVGSKDRDATEAGQVAGAVVMAVLFGTNAMQFDTKQKIRVSLVTRPIDDQKTAVRVTFQRIVWNNHNVVSKIEGLTDPTMYQQFFDKLSQSVFLTANEI
ncbi:hypothetical protein [Azospirillum brasilense]|uniref:hypothetical protein n=1 Tax=Azospirillum brasilense TaxID=192 RepID=UPI001EDBB2F8|nr:hypothetical protein [Azospirillum brasilense]UKJ77872.1 hypothetical protein H1Q64_30050 [Azospirillum brasilense]